MATWHCHDRLSGERFEVHGSSEEQVEAATREYLAAGIDDDAGAVEYDVIATAVDGSEYVFAGEVSPAGA
jgi:hypothetical protein